MKKTTSLQLKNRMKGRVDVFWRKHSKLRSSVGVPAEHNISGTLSIPYRNRMKGNVDVWWRKDDTTDSSVRIPENDYLESTISIPYRNRMKGNYDILAPKRITKAVDPIDDTYVTERSPYAIYGLDSSIRVGCEDGNKYEGLLKFNMQENFPMYSKEGYILIESVLKLTISNVRDIKDRDIDVYEVAFGDWKEESTTWANKPIKSNSLSSFYRIENGDGDTGDIDIYIDVNELAKHWLDNPRKNNGLVIQAREEIDNLISFYSKENGKPELNPKLIVTYIDLNSPFITKNEYLNSSLNVWEEKENCITSELEVVTRQSTSTAPSSLIALNKPGDLLASLEIVRDRLPCELDIVGSHVPASVDIYSKETNMTPSSLNVKQINPESEIKISHLYDIEADLTVGKGSYLSGFLGINANRIVNEATISHLSYVESELSTLAVNTMWGELKAGNSSVIDNAISVNGNWNISNELDILATLDLDGYLRTSSGSDIFGAIRTRGASDLGSDIFYGRFADLDAKLHIIPYSNLDGTLGIAHSRNILSIIDTLSVDLINNEVQVSKCSYLNADINVAHHSSISNTLRLISENISSEVNIIRYVELSSLMIVQGWVLDNILGVGHHSSITSDITVPDKSILSGSLYALNENIENALNVYVSKTNSIFSKLNAYAVNRIDAETQYQYGSILNNDLMVYVDKISVVWGYVEVINEDWEYEQKRGYGYIM